MISVILVFFYLYHLIFCILTFVSRAECSHDEAVSASTSVDHVVQQPMCYLEEEEEIYISEQMQEIADGIVVSCISI